MLIVYVAGKVWESLSPCIIIHSPFNKKDNSGMLKINQMWKSAKITLVYPCNYDDLNACNCSITAWLLATQIGWIRLLSLKLHRQLCPIMTKGIYGGPLQVVLLFDFPLRSDSMGSSKQLSKEENIAQYHGSEDSYKKPNCPFQLNTVLAGHEKHRNGIGRGLWEWSPQKTWKKIFLQMVHLQHNLLKEHLYGRLMSKKPFLRSRIRVSYCM